MNETDHATQAPQPAAASAEAVDEVRRFLIEREPVRGHWVHLGAAWRDLRAHVDYPPAVRDLLGEAVAAAVLLAATLKFHGTLSLQLEGNGLVRLLIAQCTHDFGVRAVARFEPADFQSDGAVARSGGDFKALVGDHGRVIVTIEATEREARYQGVVPLSGESLAESLEAYFASSEQLPTRVRLSASAEDAVGLLIQKLPEPQAHRQPEPDRNADELNVWDRAQQGIASLPSAHLLHDPFEVVLGQTLGGEDLRVFSGAAVRSECRCNPERVSQLLRALGEAEVTDVVREQGSVTVTCEFCQRPYRFSAADAQALFSSDAVPPGSGALH